MRIFLPTARCLVIVFWLCCALSEILCVRLAAALDGDIRMHDPSTVILCDGRYYVFSTGDGIPIFSSADGWNWERSGKVFDRVPEPVHSAVPLNNGQLVWAPDVMKRNDEYYLYYSISSWGSEVSAIGLVTNPTLNRKDPRYKWTDRGIVVYSVKGENLNTIDPGVLQAPDNTLWLSYGSYIGNVQLVQLDPKTGLRIAKDSPTYILSSQSEASDIIYHGGYYYLFVNRGSCCKKRDSTYNIRMGRSRTVTGPYLDPWGEDMAHGGGALFLAAQGKQIGPGHFGLLQEDGVEKFSCHYEADLDHEGRSVLAIQPLLWGADGWPVAGMNLMDGTYQIRSKRTGLTIRTMAAASSDTTTVRQSRYVVLDEQKWELHCAGKYCTLQANGGKQALQATATAAGTAQLSTVAPSSSDNQLWQIDQLSDGSYRIESMSSKLALTADTAGEHPDQVELKEYRGDDTQRWIIAAP